VSGAQGSKPDGPGPRGMVLFISPAGAQTKSPAPGDGSYLSTRRGCLGPWGRFLFIHPAGASDSEQRTGHTSLSAQP
jgi:hypothetical protein